MLLKERIIKEVGKIFVPQLGQRKNWMLKSLQYSYLLNLYKLLYKIVY